MAFTETEVMLFVLSLIDVVMIANLRSWSLLAATKPCFRLDLEDHLINRNGYHTSMRAY